MRLKAKQQTTQKGFPIVFLSLQNKETDGLERTLAQFQYKHVYEHPLAWSDITRPYVVNERVDVLDQGFPIPHNPVESYLPGKFSFTAGFWQSLPQKFRNEVRAKLAEKDLAEKQACDTEYYAMKMQDMESVAQNAGVSQNVARFLQNLADFPDKSFESPSVLRDVMNNPSSMFQDIDGLTNVFWQHLSAYQIRGRQSDKDITLFNKCCEVRNGPRRCRAARQIN
eukprot:11142183-Karenia_brevis.AAC.1